MTTRPTKLTLALPERRHTVASLLAALDERDRMLSGLQTEDPAADAAKRARYQTRVHAAAAPARPDHYRTVLL